MAVIGINYSGSDHDYEVDGTRIDIDPSDANYLKYESVYLHYKDGEKTFNSGNFIKDWFDAKRFYDENISVEDPYLSDSSSCNHFFMDGAKFDSAYLHFMDDKPVLKYIDTTDEYYFQTQREIYENGWEFFVIEGTKPTWEELKEMCKNLEI